MGFGCGMRRSIEGHRRMRGIKSPTRTRFDSGVGGIIIETSEVGYEKA
jgi:hypothetical protein